MRYIDINSNPAIDATPIAPMIIQAWDATDCCPRCGDEGMLRRSHEGLDYIECQECGHAVTFTAR